ncbi:alpha/beta fold hydrolase [Candidatus Viridilinea mediisalina]|uniref:Alpha/beta hydrolase n=1 Tax=Candidatus Viridilinea mediisalina TaxID=2024553 RepID=A0A2A6RNH8_9CHLR|nr:alpha/beta hydrolase [Candidatus Viridilinea mediisalina]PDW04654.1 alpha/beta hydrolase [Candidatus Viridilinea mediisalina]
MSIVVIDNQVVHYEVLGRGRPVVFLHGWLGSWRYWFPTMEVVAKHFRTYSFDFWGFGESRRKQTQESIQAYSDQITRFLDELGIERVILVGHSMGGMVALKTALSYPERICAVATVGAPINGDSLSWLLKLTDRPFFADAFARMPWLRRQLFRFFLGVANDLAVGEMIDDSVKSTANTLRYAVSSMWRTDLSPELFRLSVPALIVHGGRDDVVNPNQADLFTHNPKAEVVMMPRSRHFPFLEEPALFNDVLLRFLKANNLPATNKLPELVAQRQSTPAR